MIANQEKYTNEICLDECPVLIAVEKELKTGMVRTIDGRTLEVKLSDFLVNNVELYDQVRLGLNMTTGELTVIDYYVTFEGTDNFITNYQDEYGEY